MSVRLITRPYSKLTRLCAEAAKGGGALTTFAMVAKALNVTTDYLLGMDAEAAPPAPPKRQRTRHAAAVAS